MSHNITFSHLLAGFTGQNIGRYSAHHMIEIRGEIFINVFVQ